MQNGEPHVKCPGFDFDLRCILQSAPKWNAFQQQLLPAVNKHDLPCHAPSDMAGKQKKKQKQTLQW